MLKLKAAEPNIMSKINNTTDNTLSVPMVQKNTNNVSLFLRGTIQTYYQKHQKQLRKSIQVFNLCFKRSESQFLEQPSASGRQPMTHGTQYEITIRLSTLLKKSLLLKSLPIYCLTEYLIVNLLTNFYSFS